jgi:hypothetical protein
VPTSIRQISKLLITIQIVISDCIGFACGLLRNRTALVAENLFLRKQLALFLEREERARQTTAADRFIFAKLARLFGWGSALVIVKPATLISWHRAAFRHFWHWISQPSGRPKLPVDIRIVIRRMAAENPTWGQDRIADELLLKLGSGFHRELWASISNNSRVREDHGISAGPHSCATMLTLLWPATSWFPLRLVSYHLCICRHGDRISTHPPLRLTNGTYGELFASGRPITIPAVLIGHSDLASRMRRTENYLFVILGIRFRWALGSHPSRFSVVFITSITGKITPHEMPI